MTQGPVETFRRKAQAIAQVLAERLAPAEGDNPWAGYTADEELFGQLTGSDSALYTRRGHPGAMITLGFLTIEGAEQRYRSKPTVIDRDILEERRWDVDIQAGTSLDETYSHTFKKAKSETDAWKEAWGIAADLSLGVDYAGVKFGIDIKSHLDEEKSHSGTESEETSDTVSRTFHFVGPKDSDIVAERSKDREQRTIRVAPNPNFKTYFHTGDSTDPASHESAQYEWSNWKAAFLPALEGHEPENTDYTAFASNSSIRAIMLAQPLTAEEHHLLTEGSDHEIEFSYVYDNVTRQGIYERPRNKEA